MSFEDHFSQSAQEYARYRPSYPPELFAYLASLCTSHQLAWDCGTPKMMQMLDEVKWDMVNEWDQTKQAPKHAAWMHDGSMSA